MTADSVIVDTPPLSDIAIAALAIEHDLSVFTVDRHFDDIPGVKLHKDL